MASSAARLTVPAVSKMASIISGDVTIAYDDIGPREARAVLLLHGFATNRKENWQRLGWYGAFERKRFRMIAMDSRGHGESGKPRAPEAYAREAILGDAFALLDALAITRADLFGYSMGARLALAAALAQPERFSHVVLGGIGGRLFHPPLAGNPMAEAMEAEDANDIAEPMLKSFRHFADEQGEDRAALAALSRAGQTCFTPDMLRTLRVPVLVVAGARDTLAGDPKELARTFPHGRAVTLPGCDHFSAIPHGLFKAAVFDFLDDVLE